MEFSNFTTASGDTAGAQDNMSHITIARKLQDYSRRIRYAKEIFQKEGILRFGGYTGERVGPPSFVAEPLKVLWRKDIRACANRCVWNYLLPEYQKKLRFYTEKAINDIGSKINEENKERIERGIQLGRDRANKKWDIREGLIRDKKGCNIGKRIELGPHNISEIGLLVRGEMGVVEGEEIVRKGIVKQTEDVYRALAHIIHGSVRYSKIVVRNLWKYIQIYEEEERRRFIPFVAKLMNNTYKKIHTWRMFCAYIRNRDIEVTTFELDIISRTYDIRVIIYRNSTDGFECTWASEIAREREAKILYNQEGKWEVLEKKRKTINTDLAVSDIDTVETGVQKDKEKPFVQHNQESQTVTQVKESIVSKKKSMKQRIDISISNNKEDRYEAISKIKKKQKRILWQEWRKKYRTRRKNMEKRQDSLIKRDKAKEKSKQLVFDFTTTKLSPAEIDILSKGESFCVARHKVNEDRLKTDIFNYSRRLRLHEEFREPKVESNENENRWSIITNTQNNNTQSSISSRQPSNKVAQREEISRDATRVRGNNWPQNSVKNLTQNSRENRWSSITNTQGSNRGVQPTNSRRQSNRYALGSNRYLTQQRASNRMSSITQTASSSQYGNHRNSTNIKDNVATESQDRNKDRPYNNKKLTQQRVSNRMSSITQTTSSSQNGNHRNNVSIKDNVVIESQDRNKDRSYNSKNKVRKPVSTYDPESNNRNLNRYINCISEESLLIVKDKGRSVDNITKEERLAIESLKSKIENNEIIISKADKGSGLVVLDYEVYINKGTKYIEVEAKAYERVNDTTKNIIGKLVKYRNNIVQRLKNSKVIEIETATYCNKQLEEKITGIKFYYKVHKDTNIATMPLRPLQSCINAPTHHLSQVLTDILQPYLKVEYIPTYIQDSNQLLYRLESMQNLDEQATLISSDVAALYPSIPHREGLLAMTQFLKDNTSYDEVQIKSIVKALELVITENYVIWNNQIYKQTSGVAMGTPVAVAYANIFMHWIDEEIKGRAPYVIEHIRYIDDNLFIVPTNKIAELMEIANNILTPNIKFTYEMLDKKADIGLAFLDTQLFITEERKIISRLYTKKTDKHAYLLPSSYHPAHITRNIPLAVFNRIRRICSKEAWFEEDASKAIGWLEDRQYKCRDIMKAVEISKKKDRWTLIKNIEDKRDESKDGGENSNTIDTYDIPYLVTYSQNTMRIKQVLKQRQKLLDACFIKTKVRPRLTYRRQKNINDTLVQRSLRGPITSREEKKFTLCGERPKYRTICPCKSAHDQKICRCCAHSKLKVEGIKVKLNKSVDCDTKNIIYMIGCQVCRKRYVGETQQKLKDRLLQHLNNIAKLKQPLYTHFNQIHDAKHLFITILETVNSEEVAYRRVREAWWINKLQTLEPRGFNVKLECSQTYEANKNTIRIERQASTISRNNRYGG